MNLLAQNNALGGLQQDATDLVTSLQALGTLAANQAVGASSSDPPPFRNYYGRHHPSELHDQFRNHPGERRFGKVPHRLYGHHLHARFRHGLVEFDRRLTELRADFELEQPGGPARRHRQLRCACDRLYSHYQYRQLSVGYGKRLGAAALQLIDDPVTPDNPGGSNTELLTKPTRAPMRSSI